MSSRRPSFGFVWLAVTLLAAGGGWLWLTRPFWFELDGPARARGGAAYRTRLADAADPDARRGRADILFDDALQQASAGDASLLFATLEELAAVALLPVETRCEEVVRGRAWLLSRPPAKATAAGLPTLLVVHNDTAAATDMTVILRRDDGAEASVGAGDATTPLSFVDDRAQLTITDLAVDATALRMIFTSAPVQLHVDAVTPP